ncbi:alpha-ketoacid dehydrogenase subunit beta [Heyndrickxia oleronia]|uniref:Alpha-ketoacid dehydrogenase subunit beta n=1 Tax=Heyndrickxia oleronia TaxID=38875 RepID=A0AAW6T0J4_9BACI|nr:alpha-ketoacid dehydrogenase subunit beta [Heyndrickxia oleronia]NYV68383.1 alpha-ketoacid dehydrogenase subunit beta [Bacillus sp. Gen3]OJH17709.1 alpha-ketoacid dehydrogenase subunit beta [Bacillus obstructivus]MBU5213222.1 alpha-ketoacid dehydrogenase subunit beta [Heyndrickxia oleronia]MCM3239419.1 alpha-ketoacid dehydrogenase subunit beta [Heyndrickxia oleronia]MDH5161766.1 alpha-ketoacid dehydrogenase subunit beta [Heyndrickxia oleronia]
MSTITAKTQKLSIVQAVTDGLRTVMKEQEEVLVLGEDVGKNGGVFRATEGLQEQFGPDRVIDTPLSESGIVGTAIGLAINGFLPVVEMQFLGFIYPAYEQIMTHATRIRMRTLSHFHVPLVIRAPYGAGVKAPEIHSDSVEALFTHMPGIKVVCPSNPYDAKGLLIASIDDPDPVLFLEPMRSYRAFKDEVPTDRYTVEIGKASLVEEGTDLTLIAWGAMVPLAVKAAQKVREQNIHCDVLDLRTLYPLDKEMIAESVQKTGRAVIVHEAHATSGLGTDIIALIQDTSFLYLKSPIQRVTGFDVPVPFYTLEQHYLPNEDRIIEAIHKAIQF